MRPIPKEPRRGASRFELTAVAGALCPAAVIGPHASLAIRMAHPASVDDNQSDVTISRCDWRFPFRA
jgi:hypothetical protein